VKQRDAIGLIVLLCLCGFIGAVLYPVILAARPVGPRVQSLSNLKVLSSAWLVYAADSDDVTSPATHWNDLIQPYLRDSQTLLDPLLKDEDERRGYGYNPFIANTELFRVEALHEVVAFGLTQHPGKDAQVSAATLREYDSGEKLTLLSFTDGHVKTQSTGEMERLKWRPKLLEAKAK
jgi:hypothetical protein